MSSDQPMTTVVEFQIRPENTTMPEWLGEWEKRGEDARIGEPETSAYAAAVNLDNELNVLVFERYSRGDGSLALHMERPAHKTLTETMGKRQMTKRRVMSTRFDDIPDFGWWGRSRGDKERAEGLVLVLTGFRFENSEKLQEFLDLSTEHAAYCWDNEPDTLVYSGGIARADADRELDLKKGDLVFAMACSNMEAVEKHRTDANHLALGATLAEQQIVAEKTFQRTYRTTGLGFLWR